MLFTNRIENPTGTRTEEELGHLDSGLTSLLLKELFETTQTLTDYQLPFIVEKTLFKLCN